MSYRINETADEIISISEERYRYILQGILSKRLSLERKYNLYRYRY